MADACSSKVPMTGAKVLGMVDETKSLKMAQIFSVGVTILFFGVPTDDWCLFQ